MSHRLAIDLGTTNTLIHVEGQGVVVNEPTVVAVSNQNEIIAIGNEVKEMLGRTPDMIDIYRPIRSGVIADFHITEAMLRHFIDKVIGKFRFFRPEVMLVVPGGVTSTERRAVIDAAKSAGAKEVYLIKAPLAAAIGSGIPVTEPVGNMIVALGGGTTETAVISLGGIVASESIRVGGQDLDTAIVNYIRTKYNLFIGDQTAEEVKHTIGSATFSRETLTMEIRGRDLREGLPRTITINATEITECLRDELEKILMALRSVLEKTPPELASDLLDSYIVLTGGSALLKHIDQLITNHVGMECRVAEDPLFAVVKGA
ncbi:MAG: rod shape-determining protein, partial [Candidatus Abawacabacteria bacterium RIFCSPHIGHO2_01_FULL_46_8]